ncbi:MAG: thioredoxin family protein [Candidatus Thermoplasmatota archaeon]|nr:thioredoxin family protein [Candidatus Thermoplasmatota archaeon]
MIASATEDSFKADVLNSQHPVLALFHARWCGFCQAFLPIFRRVKGDDVELVEVDISDEASPLWDTYGLEVVPTLILFRNGTVVDRADGRFMRGLREADLERLLEAARENER